MCNVNLEDVTDVKCEKCGSIDHDYGNINVETIDGHAYAIQSVHCTNCEHEWDDLYKFEKTR